MSQFTTAVERARAELAANPKLRLGVWLIVAILAGYFAFVVQAERADVVAADYASAQARLTRGQDLLARQDWAERLAAARATEADLRGRFWQAPNEGLAQARLGAVIEELTAKLHLARPLTEVGLSRPVPDVPGLWQVQARMVGSGVGPASLRLLHRVATQPKKLVMERLELTRSLSSLRVDLMLSAYFLLEDVGRDVGLEG